MNEPRENERLDLQSLDYDVQSLEYIEELYREWRKNGVDLPDEWRSFFSRFEESDHARGVNGAGDRAGSAVAAPESLQVYKQSRVDSLIWAYRDVGYVYADLNPLKQYTTPELRYMYYTMEGNFERLDPDEFDLSAGDLDREFLSGRYLKPDVMRLREIIERLRAIYSSTMGVEILHIQNKPMRRWLIERMESDEKRKVWSVEEKRRFQKDLVKAEEFEKFIHSNFIGQKRFSLEGAEVLIPAVHYLIRNAGAHGIEEIVVGMAHRGRLNVLTNAMRKPAYETFDQFTENYQPHVYGGSGDVKYHLGQSFDYTDKTNGKKIHISLVPNPSHLESVDPVVEGKTRGIQRRRGDRNRKKVLPVLIHGDAAFSGQGVVAETFNLSQLKGYRTGGTIHIIINNQIGFTTASRDARSTFFATNIARSLPVPIIHVNGDDPETVLRAVDIAMDWRQKFAYDVVIDVFCYRRYGHNEADEPSFTHPLMYSLIKEHPSVTALYGKKLAEEGTFSEDEQTGFRDKYRDVLKGELDKSKSGKSPEWNDAFKYGEWQGFSAEYSFDFPETGVDRKILRKIGQALLKVPDGFGLHPKLQRFVSERKKALEAGERIDWAFAESLAFGSLLLEGYPIRLSGEDVSRGTFSQRHAVWWDVNSPVPKTHVPLRTVSDDQAWFSTYDSPLSEFSVLGFDYGYSLSQPNILVIWEAQFGDFVNGAQVIIDNFIVSGESKWFRSSGLVMLLPHGFEGQGPEHSSGHVERFLQLCADDNMQVCNLTTPAQYFHLLRKQMLQRFRKPLVVMTPKSLLRHKEAVSALGELEEGTFRTVLPDGELGEKREKASTVLFCTGKVYYDLIQRRRELGGREDVSIVRIEQLYPFPEVQVRETLEAYEKPERICWVQEEPENRGAWRFMREYLGKVTGVEKLQYCGRPECPSPATGSHELHKQEFEAFMRTAFMEEEKVRK